MKKQFGQNFLTNKEIISKIIESAEIKKNSIVYEVGSGNGILTKEIIQKKPIKFISIEIDTALKKKLEILFQNTNYKLIFTDALNFDENNHFKNNVIIISNLPYYISLKLLLKWIFQFAKKRWIHSMILMFQKEVADRILSESDSKKFGRITLLVSAFFKVNKIIDVDKNNFYPVPKVNSSVLKFTPLENPLFNFLNLNKLELLSKIFFSNKRKKLKKKIEEVFDKKTIKHEKLDKFYNLRAENLDKKTFFYLAKLLK
jgi:16S rRNA (adenine1518-N6/adenine1519-N6)-dimethyltransferase